MDYYIYCMNEYGFLTYLPIDKYIFVCLMAQALLHYPSFDYAYAQLNMFSMKMFFSNRFLYVLVLIE